MKNSLLILNKEKAWRSELGYDEIYILYLTQVSKFPQSTNDDDYNEPMYDCECLVKKDGVSSVQTLSFHLLSFEVDKGIYEVSEKIDN